MWREKSIEELKRLLIDWEVAYRSGAPKVPDRTYDYVLSLVREKEPDFDPVKYLPVSKEIKVGVDIPDIELIKTEDPSKITGGTPTLKADGVLVKVLNDNGRIIAATRGGIDVTSKILNALGDLKFYPGVTYMEAVYLSDKNDPSLRNAVSGDLMRKTHVLDPDVKFVLIGLRKLGGAWIPGYELNLRHPRIINVPIVKDWKTVITDTKKSYNKIPWDGIVFMNPEPKMALKISSEGAIVKVKEVRWEIGKTGRINPKIKFDPVHLGGVRISSASAHSYDYVQRNGIGPGAIVVINRVGMVIPVITNVIEPAEPSKPNIPYEVRGKHAMYKEV